MSHSKTLAGTQTRWLAAAAGLLCLAVTTIASGAEVERPCMADFEKLCKDVQPGEGRVARCMKEHEKELSPGCKANIEKAKERIKDVAEACRGDAENFCSDVEPGKGRILRCLKQHEGELSTSCKEQLTFPHTRS